MRKGFITLMAAAFAFLGASTFANAPTIRSIPDVVITDTEQPALTADINFFRYMNAFDVRDYASDSDTDYDALKFSFREGTTHNNVAINGAEQLGGGETAANPPAGKQLTDGAGGGYWFNFRDILRNPLTDPDPTLGSPAPDPGVSGILPWQNTDGVDTESGDSRVVTVWVTDGDTDPTSTTFLVLSINGDGTSPLDTLSGGFNTVFTSDLSVSTAGKAGGVNAWYDWAADAGFSDPAVSLATTTSGAGTLGIIGSPTFSGSVNFARWEQCYAGDDALGLNWAIPQVDGNTLYCALYSIEHNAADRSSFPGMRIGVQNSGFNVQLFNTIVSAWSPGANDADANPQLADSGVTREYPLYWENMADKVNYDAAHLVIAGTPDTDARTWGCFFDMFDNDAVNPKDGTITLSDFHVVTASIPDALDASSADRVDYDDVTGGAWGQDTGNGTYTVNANSPATGMITVTAPASAGTSGTFFLYHGPNDVPWNQGKLLRTTYYLSCPTAADRTNFHRARIRNSNLLFSVNTEMFIRNSLGDAIGHPACPPVYSGTPTDLTDEMRYAAYVPAYGGSSSFIDGLSLGTFQTFFDYLSNADDAAHADVVSAVSVHKAMYELLADPLGLD